MTIRTLNYESLGKKAGICLVLIVAAARTWIARYSMNADGISYLDLSDTFRRHDWPAFVNGYWSPLYPALLGIVRSLLPSSKRWDMAGAHLTNYLIFLVAFLCFEYFYRSLRAANADRAEANPDLLPVPEWALWILAHGLFLWVSVDLITMAAVSPDLCVSAFVYLIAGLLLRFRSQPGWKLAALLGLALGGAYWAKAVMFPLALSFMAIALVSTRKSRTAVRAGFAMLACFAMVAGPLVATLSLQKQRLTFGDSGAKNYAMFVSPGGMSRNWQGEPELGIVAKHPTRKLPSDPPIYEFAAPIGGTFPVWYDPSYWEDGRVPRFNLKAQLRTIATNLASDLELLLHQQNCLLVALLTLILLLRRDAWRAVAGHWPVLLLCTFGMGIYVLVHTENRFVGGYIALLWLALLTPLRVPASLQRMSAYLFLATALAIFVGILSSTARAARDAGPNSALQDVALSDWLDGMGLHPGNRIAVIGGAGFYAARLSQVRIVAEIMDEDSIAFWRLPPEKQQSVFDAFTATGARLILARDPSPALALDSGWIKVKGVPAYIRWLR